MKKMTKRLVLTKETIRGLENTELTVAGAIEAPLADGSPSGTKAWCCWGSQNCNSFFESC
jgi:hypothetical protein